MRAFRTYIFTKVYKQAAARSFCDSWASCTVQSDLSESEICLVYYDLSCKLGQSGHF